MREMKLVLIHELTSTEFAPGDLRLDSSLTIDETANTINVEQCLAYDFPTYRSHG